ncbi:unnamed protein product [Brachionus calyciflorus]|uniref:Centromere protein J C-terminal domain-containing protein n=1 Tax=Brachionus calyciflorus TaxID=104777 RepID=A0A813TB22_9BILA|nr:unnamed protein product [Brachionus calyciflorus]
MLDIDSLPIGVKPTNRMNFEELIEEKLKIADQLEKEQIELSNKLKNKKKAKPVAEPIEEEKNDSNDESDPEVEITLDDEEHEHEHEESKPKPRPFLKRGEGLKRYQPETKKKSDSNKKSNLNRKSVSTTNTTSKPKQTTTTNSASKSRVVAKIDPKINENKTTQKKIEPKNQPSVKPKTVPPAKTEVKKMEVKAPENKMVEKVPENKKIEIEEKEEFQSNYFQPKLVQSSHNYEEHNNQPHNDTELNEFENLEKYVEEHPSFRSSSSFLEAYVSKNNNNQYSEFRVESQEVYSRNFYKNIYDDDSDLEEFMSKKTPRENDLDLDSNNRTLENEIKNQNTSSSSSIVSRKIKRISSTNKLVEKEDHQGIFAGMINEKNFDYMCSNYKDEEDEFDNFDMVNNNYNKYESETEDIDFEDYKNYKKSMENREPIKKVKFDDSSSWLDQYEKSPIDDFSEKNEFSKQFEPEEPAQVSKLINKLFPSLKEQEEKKQQALIQQQKQKDQEKFDRLKQEQFKNTLENQKSTSSTSSTTNINANVLREKINQLESEIELFKKKNGELNKLKEKLDTEAKLAETNRKLFDKQKQEEFTRLKEIHDEEMRKLKQEKKIFEQYKQSIKDKPDRKERDEIERLNKQIMELTEEMKTRESRWITNNNRLKERIENLEHEKSELKKELQFFEKQRIESLIKMTNQQNQNNQIQHTRSESPVSYQNIPKNIQNYKGINKNLTISTNSFNSESDYFQQQNGSYQNLKRTTSEKSLPNSSPSSSSSSIGSTGSLATNSNLNLNQPQPNIIQHSYRPNSINSPLTSNSYDSIKSDIRVQNHKSISPQQPNLVKSVKFNPEQLKETRYYSPNGTNLIENDEYETTNYRTNNLPTNIPNNYRPQPFGHIQNQILDSDYVISSLTGVDRNLRVKDIRVVEGKQTEKLLEDDTLITIFPNGTIKEVSADKMKILVKFFNGDRKEVNRDTGTETYSYAETNITQIIYSNGLEILKFPNGQIEKHHVDKTREIIFPDKICKFIYPDGREETRLPNGTFIKVDKNGDKVIEYPNKQREIHTKDYKKREYPDGSVKTVYTNGLSETKYSNGRVRLKDSLGNVISDTKA